MDDVRIGDFSRPIADPKTAAKATTKESLDAMANDVDQALQKDEAAIKPLVSFEERLKEAGLTRDKAAAIVDSVLVRGYYSEDIKITSTIKIRLRTRNARDTKRAQEIIEARRLTYDVHYNELLSRILLASSLEQFAEDKLPHPQGRKASQEDMERAFQERLTYVDTMPDPALRIAMSRLVKFDRMVSAALEEGSIENF